MGLISLLLYFALLALYFRYSGGWYDREDVHYCPSCERKIPCNLIGSKWSQFVTGMLAVLGVSFLLYLAGVRAEDVPDADWSSKGGYIEYRK